MRFNVIIMRRTVWCLTLAAWFWVEMGDAKRFDSRQRRDILDSLNATKSTPATPPQKRQSYNQSKLLAAQFSNIMKTYDKRFRPDFGGKAVEVSLDAYVLSFSRINEAEMEYTMDLYFGQFWQDDRFIVTKATENDSIALTGEEVQQLWLPDTIFINSKRSSTHKVTVDNRFLTIYYINGLCVYHTRITLWVACRMDLRRYPFDTQNCELAIESYGHDKLDLKYKWRQQEGCEPNCSKITVYDGEMSKFDLVEASKSATKTRYHTDTFSWATVHFKFRRRSQYFIPRVYAPCVLIVIVSFTTFWISKDAIPARAAICITSILTLITMLGVVNANMPEVSYMKSLDLYLLVSFVFVFCALLEYITVLNVHVITAIKHRRETARNHSRYHNGTHELHQMENGNGDTLLGEGETFGPHCRTKYRKSTKRIRSNGYVEDKEKYSKKYNNRKTSKIDMIARVLFPLSYGVLNLIYWVISLQYE